MNATNQAILIVEQAGSRNAREDAIYMRLEKMLGYNVSVYAPHEVPSPLPDASLVIVCAKHVSGDMRQLELPVLVCNPSALFDLGMTMGKAKVDFGNQMYSNVFIGPETIGESLSPGNMGRRPITDDQADQGWAKPGPKAIVVATVGGDSSKAVAFAYDKGAEMPALDAAHRRGAFLAGDATGQLRAEGWKLFDAVAKGVAEGGTWAESPGPAALWFLKDGLPTRSMAADEYREWVHDQVEKKLWARWNKIFAVVGVSSVVGIVSIAYTTLSFTLKTIDTTAKEHVDTQLKTLPAKVETQARAVTVQSLAELLLKPDSNMGEQVEKQLIVSGGKAIKNLINDKDGEVRKQLVDAAVKGLIQNGKSADDLLNLYESDREDRLQNKTNVAMSPVKRRLILQMSHVYATTDAQRSRLRALVREVILDAKEPEHLRAAALELFQPRDVEEQDQKDLYAILDRFGNQLYSRTIFDAFDVFFSNFSDDHAGTLLQWLFDGHNNLEQYDAKNLLIGIAKLKPKTPGDPRVMRVLIDFAVDADPAKNLWAAAALKHLTVLNHYLDPGTTPRQESLQKLLAKINEAFSAKTDGNSDPDRNLRVLQGILIGFLRVDEDDDLVADAIGSGKRAGSKALQALLSQWTARLGRENKSVPPKSLQRLFGVADVFDAAGTAALVKHVLARGEPGDAAQFLKRLPDWTAASASSQAAKNSTINLLRTDALRAAIELDARSAPPFSATIQLLRQLSVADPHGIKRQVEAALLSYAYAPQRRPEDFNELARVVDAGNEARITAVFSNTLDQFQTYLIDRAVNTGKLDEALKVHDKIVTRFSKSAQWRYKRGVFYFDKLGQADDAIADLSEAIRLEQAPEKQVPYHLKRGIIQRKTAKSVDVAIEDFEAALVKLPAVKDMDPYRTERRQVHHELAFALIKKGSDDANAKVDALIQESVKGSATDQDRGGTLENLGLLYLKQGKWREAYDNSTTVNKYDRELAWNWLVRCIAAAEMAKQAKEERAVWASQAQEAKKTWRSLFMPNDFAKLHEVIPRLLREHLGVVHTQEYRLQASPKSSTVSNKPTTRAHTWKFSEGKKYTIDMESSVFDTYLILNGPDGEFLTADDDSGGNLNARITWTAKATGEHQIIATSFGGRSQGVYALTIRELAAGED